MARFAGDIGIGIPIIAPVVAVDDIAELVLAAGFQVESDSEGFFLLAVFHWGGGRVPVVEFADQEDVLCR